MASIFEEMMTANHNLTESAKPSTRFGKKSKMVKECRKINCKCLRVESRKFFEENDIDDLEKDFAVPEDEKSDEVVLVIDPELPSDEEVPEEAAEEMVGDKVYKCPVCGSNYVCDCDKDGMVEGIEVDEDGAPLECPICGDDADQILIGEIAPAEEAPGEEVDPEPEKPEEDEGEEEEEIPEEEVPEDAEDDLGESLTEDLDEVPEEVPEEERPAEDPEDMMVLDTDSAEVEEEEEKPAPEVVVTDSEVTLVLDDAKLESMMNKMIKENYKGNSSFKVTKVSCRGKNLKIEYMVRNGKKTSKGLLVGEGFNKESRLMKVAFRDKGVFTESFAKTPSIIFEFAKIGNKVIPTKMKYDFKVKVNESLYRVAGKVDRSTK